MTIQQFIDKAVEGGWRSKGEYQYFTDKGPQLHFRLAYSDIWLDPEAWKAVGKVEGWPEHNHLRHSNESKSWRGKFVGMSEHLADGFSSEQYLETL